MTWLPFAQWGEYEELHNHQAPVVQPLDSAIQRLNNQGQDNPWEGGAPIWNRRRCSSEILDLTPKGDHLGVPQAFCDPQRRPI